MIVLNLKEIFESTDKFTKSYVFSPEELRLPSELGEIREKTFVDVEISKVKGGYSVSLSIEGGVFLECSRCLTLYRKELTQALEKKVQMPPQDREIFLSNKDLNVSFMEAPDLLNLTDMVREEIILNIPMKPLCSPNCMGISHITLMEEEGSHSDPRFAILKSLLVDKEDSNS
jgi:uncharacterized protein